MNTNSSTKIIQYSPGPSGGPGDSQSLKECQSLLSEYLPKLKSLPKASITRQVCGGCLDFKVSITQPLEEHGAWAEKNYEPLESEFMEKLKKIEGTSLHEVQESESIQIYFALYLHFCQCILLC